MGQRLLPMMILLASGQVWAGEGPAPGRCDPPCRSGFSCKEGRCVSLCNPPCPAGERCNKGECELMPRPGEPMARYNYLGVFGLLQAALSGSAAHLGEVRLEFGGKYATFQLGPAFGKGLTAVRAAILGHFSFQPFSSRSFMIIPTLSLGYIHTWVSDPNDLRRQDIFIAPGLRVRYDLTSRLALMADLVQIQISFLRLESSKIADLSRQSVVPVWWNLGLGVIFLY
jgi:hypothetical protein